MYVSHISISGWFSHATLIIILRSHEHNGSIPLASSFSRLLLSHPLPVYCGHEQTEIEGEREIERRKKKREQGIVARKKRNTHNTPRLTGSSLCRCCIDFAAMIFSLSSFLPLVVHLTNRFISRRVNWPTFFVHRILFYVFFSLYGLMSNTPIFSLMFSSANHHMFF